MNDFKKVIHPVDSTLGREPNLHGRQPYFPVFCEITFKDGRLSIHGTEAPMSNGNCRGGCGQIDTHYRIPGFREEGDDIGNGLRLAPDWTAEMWYTFLKVWNDWHLNDLHSGCEHQRALGWEKDGYDKHPSEPCPECGYKYGSAWHVVMLPEDVYRFLDSLPETDREPWWV